MFGEREDGDPVNCWCCYEAGTGPKELVEETLPKALRTQALTALTSNFGLVGLVQYAWKAMFDLFW